MQKVHIKNLTNQCVHKLEDMFKCWFSFSKIILLSFCILIVCLFLFEKAELTLSFRRGCL